MSKKLALIYLSIVAFLNVDAQSGDVVALKVNGKPVYKSEIEKAYAKSKSLQMPEEEQSFDDFLQSYIDFRLNVEEAKAQRLDTTASYQREYYSYKVELGRAYLKDTIVINKLLEKYYQRILQDVKVNHVLLPFGKKEGMILPSDTLELYNSALQKRQQLVANGFKGDGFINNTLNPSLVMDLTSINGQLGWITAFMLPLQLEDAVYSLKKGEVSKPIRTQRGYHLVQVVDKRSAVGAARVDQVIFNFPTVPPSSAQIDSVGALVYTLHDQMNGTADYQVLCDRFSEVYHTGDKKCNFGIVKLDSKLSPSFINAALELRKEGDVSEPVMTDYGYHILRLTAKIPIPEFEKIEPALQDLTVGGDRGELYRYLLRQSMGAKYALDVNSSAFVNLQREAAKYDVDDPGFYNGIARQDKILMTVGGVNNYKVSDFLDFVKYKSLSKINDPNDLPSVMNMEEMYYNFSADKLDSYFTMFAVSKLMQHAEETLEERNSSFKAQMKEYGDGILLFDVKKKNIWDKAQSDEKGLAAVFKANKSKYKWDTPKYKGAVLYCKDEDTMRKAEALYVENGQNESALTLIRSTLNRGDTKVIIEKDTWAKGDNAYVDNKVFGENRKVASRPNYSHVTVLGRFISEPEDYTDVRAFVEEDYRERLEDKWNSSLRKKYKVDRNLSVLKLIKKNK